MFVPWAIHTSPTTHNKTPMILRLHTADLDSPVRTWTRPYAQRAGVSATSVSRDGDYRPSLVAVSVVPLSVPVAEINAPTFRSFFEPITQWVMSS
jgi:hypothetical protein